MRSKHDPKVERLAALPVFSACSRETLKKVGALLDECTFSPGETMVQQGQRALAFFVIETGIADVSADGRRIATLGPGDMVGETAMLDHLPRSATVAARGTLTAFAASVVAFQKLIGEHPAVTASLMRQMASRLRVGINAFPR